MEPGLAESETVNRPGQHLEQYKWKAGVSANPKGRPAGSRNKLGEAFVSALQDDFLQHGPDVIKQVRIDKPEQYLKVIAAVIPKEFHIKDQTFEGVSDAEFARFVDALRSVLGPSEESAARVIEGRAETPVSQGLDSLHAVDVSPLSTSDVPPDNS